MATIDLQVAASGDDCSYRVSDGDWTILAIACYMGDYNATYYNNESGFRFLNVTIPNGATIDVAYLSLYGYGSYDPTFPTLYIKGEASDNPATYSTSANWLGRSYGSQTTNWAVSSFGIGSWNNTPSIVDVVQEIVNRGGWASGQAMCFKIYDTTGYQARNQMDARSWDYDDHSLGAKLHIEYSEGGVVAGEAGQAAFLVSQGQI